jgi:hypothetical protein
VTLLGYPSIGDHHLGSNVSHSCWIKGTHNTLVGQVIHWIRIDRHIVYMIELSKSQSCMHNDHTIEITHLWCDSLSIDFNVHHLFTSATIVVVKSEDLEILVLRDD